MIKNYLYTDEFSARAILKRIYLTKDQITADKLLLLVELLNQQQLTGKTQISNLAGARIRFEGFNFANGYLLQATLSQSQANGLMYLFKNPYKEALKVFNDIFFQTLSSDEKALALCKDNVKENQNELFKDTYSLSLSLLEVSYSKPIVNFNLISSMTLKDLQSSFEAVKKSKCGEYIYIGKKDKNETLENLNSFDRDFEGLPLGFVIQNKDVYGKDFINDCYSQIFEFDKISSLKDYELTKCVLSSFGYYLENKVNETYHVKCQIKFNFISNIRCLMSVIIPIGKWSMIKSLFDDVLTPHFVLDAKKYFSYSLSQLEVENIKLAGNFIDSIHRMELLNDFHLEEDKLFNTNIDFKDEDYDSKAKNIKSVNIYKCIHDKGELTHD